MSQAKTQNKIVLRPQPGPQTAFLSSPADIVIYGGGAGGGKSWSILLEPLRHCNKRQFNATFFRRTYPQIKNPGGLWDASTELYPYAGAVPRQSAVTWHFPSGCRFVMRPLKHDKNKLDWQGSELVYVAFDELTHFTEGQFWYLTSRLRSTSGIRPYLRATCNPCPADDPLGGWVRSLIDWWIDDDGFAIPHRSGVIRHFERDAGAIRWVPEPTADSRSFTFIPSTVYDNPALLSKDPAYLRNLKGLPLLERRRLLEGNWNVRATAGLLFNLAWFKLVDEPPSTVERWVRFWDFAGTGSDWTASVRAGLLPNGAICVVDVTHEHLTPAQLDNRLIAIAASDGVKVSQRWFTDPGQAGQYQSQQLRAKLRGYDAKGVVSQLAKQSRWNPLSRAAEFGEVYCLNQPWVSPFVNELVQLPDAPHDDQADAASGAYIELTGASVQKFGSASFR